MSKITEWDEGYDAGYQAFKDDILYRMEALEQEMEALTNLEAARHRVEQDTPPSK